MSFLHVIRYININRRYIAPTADKMKDLRLISQLSGVNWNTFTVLLKKIYIQSHSENCLIKTVSKIQNKLNIMAIIDV